ncbi:NADH dehydrogenase [ubiquinone] iron-sulfur protein 6, mitochondrial [Parasteatoda tepidariorum]|uniref:NADH dehydrogenase [ubiquinone] iron-sulfur protein 6, mitochondrial n=1 Tax=Parasteatoda tepidariorum TaxID=114398 RepID=UPI00077F8C3E|nr:NADH dehydrogenase [ubiquinone] iron-sulfur protein 6, mitochondrial [Parasteatoda tepidariorum]
MSLPISRRIVQQISNNYKCISQCYSSSLTKTPDTKVTHTGQKFSEDDQRMVRFLNREKQVNPHFAIDLINSIPPKLVKERVVACEGGGGPLGHPKVYINLDVPGPKACGYCGLRFQLEGEHH